MAITKRRSQVVMSPQESADALAAGYRVQLSRLRDELDHVLAEGNRERAREIATMMAGYQRLLNIAERPQ